MSFKVTVIVQKDDNWYVAKCLENSVASQGKSVEEAINNLKRLWNYIMKILHLI